MKNESPIRILGNKYREEKISLKEYCLGRNAELKKKGAKMTKWICDNCKKPNETEIPKKSEVGSKGCWDSATECYECGSISFVATFSSGITKAKFLH